MTLADYITAHLKTPFQYGVHDCVLFAVGWAELASGRQYLPKVTWKDEKSALRAIMKYVGAGFKPVVRAGLKPAPTPLEAAFDKCFTRIAPNFAKDGDLALSGGIAYLFSGPHICALGKDGLIFKSRMEAECAWTICRGDS
jgi:hypothetical protein